MPYERFVKKQILMAASVINLFIQSVSFVLQTIQKKIRSVMEVPACFPENL